MLRQLDPQLSRWHSIDLLAEQYFSESPYSYAGNNPVSNIDVMGLTYTVQDIVNTLMNSDFGGTWTNTGGGGSFSYFGSNDEAFEAGVNYNNQHGSWGNTASPGGGGGLDISAVTTKPLKPA